MSEKGEAMKVKKLIVKNIGIVVDEEIIFDKPLNLFYGEIRQGKSTLAINSIKLLFGGSFPDDLIRHGEKQGHVALEFDNAMLRRSFYFNKNGVTVARPIEFTINNKKPDGGPIEAIKKLVNPFLLDQDFLIKKTELERQRYFIQLFGVDTESLDAEYKQLESEAKDLRVEIKAFGEIDTTQVEPPDLAGLVAEKQRVDAENESLKQSYLSLLRREQKKVEEHNTEVAEHNANRKRAIERMSELGDEIIALKDELAKKEKESANIEGWILNPENSERPFMTLRDIPEPDYQETSELEEQISDAKAGAVKYEQYLNRLKMNNTKQRKKDALREKELKQRDIKQKKTAKLKEVSENSGVPGLVFDEDGNFTYQNTSAGMLSNSQLMELSSELSKLYPEGLGIELIDRGESLGRSIFNYVQRAKDEEKTILATIVGEKPAKIPENIGVFVVEQGRVKK